MLRASRGRSAHTRGVVAEMAACAALVGEGWTILGRRVRTEAGEIDLIAERDGVCAFVEVKARPTLADAAIAVTARQQARLLAAAEIVLAEHPEWGRLGVRFDLLVVDSVGRLRRLTDAFRLMG